MDRLQPIIAARRLDGGAAAAVAILIARLLAWGRFRFKSVARGADHAAAGAAADGARLLSARRLFAAVGVRQRPQVGLRRTPGVHLRRHPHRLADHQPAVRRAADPARLRGDPTNVREAAFVSGLSRWETCGASSCRSPGPASSPP